jgi:ABC-type multidrug transport system ATPase subunit
VDTPADYLSGGEQQMVPVARALSGQVCVLLLDEPFEGLAPSVVEELFEAFDKLRHELAIVIVEHNLDLVLALADHACVLERGSVIHDGPAAALREDLELRKRVAMNQRECAKVRDRLRIPARKSERRCPSSAATDVEAAHLRHAQTDHRGCVRQSQSPLPSLHRRGRTRPVRRSKPRFMARRRVAQIVAVPWRMVDGLRRISAILATLAPKPPRS